MVCKGEQIMISVIIPTYNEEKNIGACIGAVYNQTLSRSEFEIIVVDGNSKDKTVEIAQSLGATVIQQKSKGVGGARNDGAHIAYGNVIVTTDADCLPDKDWLLNIKKNFDEAEIVGLTGPYHPNIPEDMSIVESYTYRILFRWMNSLRWVVHSVYPHLIGANAAFKKDVFLVINGYSDLPYSDDVEIAKRLKKQGKLVFDKKVTVLYSLRRLKKYGFFKYVTIIVNNDLNVMFLSRKPKTDNYAKQDY